MEILKSFYTSLDERYNQLLEKTKNDFIFYFSIEDLRIGPCEKKDILKRSYNLKNETTIESKERFINRFEKKERFLNEFKNKKNLEINKKTYLDDKIFNIDFYSEEFVGFVFIKSYNFSFLKKNIPFYYLAFSIFINNFIKMKKIKIVFLNEFNNEKAEFTLDIFNNGELINIVNNTLSTEKQVRGLEVNKGVNSFKNELTQEEFIFLNKIGELSNKDLKETETEKEEKSFDVRCKKCEFVFLCSNKNF